MSMKRRDAGWIHCCDLQEAHYNDHVEIPVDLFQTLVYIVFQSSFHRPAVHHYGVRNDKHHF